ncbi:MAG TPA: carboxypeptidase regulatory-like domain-containing protein [Bryobacteraceae bacterium]|nr:carboxypeptidase regulatory-like domain-containing protein [Bryobacteraceae bacterium]
MPRTFRQVFVGLHTMLFCASLALCQDPTGVVEGQVADPSGALIPNAAVTITNESTGFTASQQTSAIGGFRFSYLPVGNYKLRVSAKGFAAYDVNDIRVDVDRVVNLPLNLSLARSSESVEISAVGAMVDVSSTLGNVVTSHDAVDLPLNGRNLTQLGLLQPGVAPLTFGLLQAGGIARANQAYAVNGEPPESNNYLLDGVTNVDSVNGGFALRTPPDAVTEFRILTSNAPPEYGETSGATTSVVTRSGTNEFHGDLYDFLRNNAFDARNFFAASTEPLHQNQFGATFGGPIRHDKDFFFAYYEGQRDTQGETRTAIVPTAAERSGNFSGLTDSNGNPEPLINEFTGQPFSFNGVMGQIPPFLLSPIALKAEALIPLPNIGPSLYSSTQLLTNNYDQGGFRFDHYFANSDQMFVRYAASSLHELDPLPINGSGVPGFPVTNGITTNSATISYVHLFSPALVQTARTAFFRNVFLEDAATNHSPASNLGFTYAPTLSSALGDPYLIISGYSDVGNPITGPQNTYQNDYQGYYSLAWTRGTHNFKFGADIDRQQINVLLGIATNGFFVFAPFPASDSFASFLLGQPVQFFQGGGDFNRGLRKWIVAGYAQDEWRVNSRLTFTYGLRYEVNTPYTDIRNRLNAWAPGKQSVVEPNAPEGILFPGDPGIPAGIAAVDYHEFMPRIGLAWDPFGDATTTIRAGYGIFYDGYTNGTGGPLQAAVSALPWTEAYQLPGPGMNFANPYNGSTPPFVLQQFVRPATILTVQSGMLPPYSQNWDFSIEHVFAKSYLLDVRYVGNKGTHLPRFIEADPAIYGPGATTSNADQRREYADCDPSGSCAFASVGLIADNNSSTYHALQISLSRQLTSNLSFLASYWWSKSLDYVSSLNIAGSAPTLVAGENDLAQNPFDLRAEHGPSLFDAKNRFVLSGTYALPGWHTAPRAAGFLVNGWQLNTIVTLSSGTPFTVYDSDNAPMEGAAPEITGFYSSRPNVLSNPNAGPHTPNAWVSRSDFQELTPAANPGQFGDEGRNAVRGPGLATVDLSLFKNFAVTESARVQFRAEAFNMLNHPNFMLPENDLASPEFGQILQAAPPRLLQLALKFIF